MVQKNNVDKMQRDVVTLCLYCRWLRTRESEIRLDCLLSHHKFIRCCLHKMTDALRQCLASFLSLALNTMADKTSPTAAKKLKKKGGGIGKRIRDLTKRPNDSASQSNLTRISVSTTASSKYIHLSVINDNLTSL